MTPETLALNANLTLNSSMIVYALAMLTFAWHLATRTVTPTERAAEQHRVAAREPALAAAGPSRTGQEHRDSLDPGRVPGRRVAAGPAETPSTASRQRGNIALMLTYLATLVLVGSVRMRGIAVTAPPWGNMFEFEFEFEFATATSAAVGVVYSALAKRNNWQWLGLFIVAPVLLVLGLSVTVLYTEAAELMPALKSYWLGIHVSIAFLAVAFFTIGFALGALSLVQQRRAGKPSPRARFLDTIPDAVTLERGAYSVTRSPSSCGPSP